LAAVAFSNVWIFGRSFFQCLDTFIECGLASLADSHPGHVSSAVSAVLVESRHFKHGPRSRRAIRPACAPTVQTTRAFAFSAARAAFAGLRRAEPAGCSFRSRARHRAGWRRLARSGVAALRGPASPGSLRAHPSRHGEDAVSCRLLCATFTGCGRNMPASAGRKWGACEHVSFFGFSQMRVAFG